MRPAGQGALRAVARSLAEFDFNRSAARAVRGGPFKQWSHTTIIHPEVALLVNFSSLYDVDPSGHHQLALLVFAQDVFGGVRRVDAERCHIPVGRGALRFDRSEVVLDGADYRLELSEPELGVHANVTLRATTEASLLQNVRVGADGLFHWAVVPRLLARGRVELRGRSYDLTDAPAYRDRNWGRFAFGELTWDWGYAIAERGAEGYAVVFTRLMDRTRTAVIEQAVMVWRGTQLLASFRDRQVAFARSGSAAPPVFVMPAPLRVCRSGEASEVPESLAVHSASSRGTIDLRFRSERTARIVVPNDGRPGTSAVHEVVGRVEVRGDLEGHAIRFEAPGFLECVHG
jgi:hypothetical protein